MKTYDKIVLNIPHSSICRYSDGWTGAMEMFPAVKRLTDWHTDMLFIDSNERVESLVFPFSRFHIDVERLVDDPMTQIGQGIIYTRAEGFSRKVTPTDAEALMALYHDYHNQLNRLCTEETMVIDCHSFPSDMSDIDVCLGYNDDESKPDDHLIGIIKETFEAAGFRVGINTPYSNSIRPSNCKSTLMIELNKRIYMNEDDLTLIPNDSVAVKRLISSVYQKILEVC